jgi:hypothetical protein
MSSPPEPSGRFGWKKESALTFTFFAVVVGVVSGIAQLGVFPEGFSRTLLVATVLTAMLYLVVRVWHFYFFVKVRELRARLQQEAEKLTLERSGHQAYLDAIERISDRDQPLFSETLEVTVWVGAGDDSDRIVERRVTTPRPLVTNRSMRPIVPTDQEQIVRLDEVGFTARRSDGKITSLPLREQINRLRVWLIFDPALSAETAWQVEYHPKGLWRPLRERGWDQLGWDDRINGTPSAFTSFRTVFKFPRSDQPPSVKERHGFGVHTEPTADPYGWEVVWTDDHPAGRHYVWDLTQPPRS